ncbi:hypothetical protein E2C01_054691 [Portunus trituberculatus]|uniref:Uncharacterized protein n=1 Tax=Portunus trituberculatus TaxID=210409 RepID=A0A5B7GTY8_PORTR|nr:hypothetical protein [Portunus trituberculatus]
MMIPGPCRIRVVGIATLCVPDGDSGVTLVELSPCHPLPVIHCPHSPDLPKRDDSLDVVFEETVCLSGIISDYQPVIAIERVLSDVFREEGESSIESALARNQRCSSDSSTRSVSGQPSMSQVNLPQSQINLSSGQT